jgi:hypothetical protein
MGPTGQRWDQRSLERLELDSNDISKLVARNTNRLSTPVELLPLLDQTLPRPRVDPYSLEFGVRESERVGRLTCVCDRVIDGLRSERQRPGSELIDIGLVKRVGLGK